MLALFSGSKFKGLSPYPIGTKKPQRVRLVCGWWLGCVLQLARLHFFSDDAPQDVFQWFTLLLDVYFQGVINQALIVASTLHLISEPLDNIRVEPYGDFLFAGFHYRAACAAAKIILFFHG